MGDREILVTELQGCITALKKLQDETRAIEGQVAGYEILVQDLRAQLRGAELPKAQRAPKQEDLQTELSKIAEAQTSLEANWRRITELTLERATLLDKLSTVPTRQPENIYDEVNHGGGAAASNASDYRKSSVQGGQLASLPSFSGIPGTDGEAWLRQVDRAMKQFNWTDEQTATAARSKLKGDAMLFVDNQEDEDVEGLSRWEGAKNLRSMLFERFSLTLSAATASHALDDLNQKTGETIDQLYDRVRYAVTKFLFDFQNKKTESYKAIYQRLLFTQFKSSIHSSYRQAIFSSVQGQQPQTATELLEAARSTEKEAGKCKRDTLKKNVGEVATSTPTTEDDLQEGPPQKDEEPSLKDLIKEVEALKKGFARRGRGGRGYGGRGRGNGGRGGQQGSPQVHTPFRGGGRGGAGRGHDPRHCHNCGGRGHWKVQCPSFRPDTFPTGQGPHGQGLPQQQQGGRGGGQGHQWRRQANEVSFDEDHYEPSSN